MESARRTLSSRSISPTLLDTSTSRLQTWTSDLQTHRRIHIPSLLSRDTQPSAALLPPLRPALGGYRALRVLHGAASSILA